LISIGTFGVHQTIYKHLSPILICVKRLVSNKPNVCQQ
jgi:hypothetical protein